jgi:organic radical activating enzyme
MLGLSQHGLEETCDELDETNLTPSKFRRYVDINMEKMIAMEETREQLVEELTEEKANNIVLEKKVKQLEQEAAEQEIMFRDYVKMQNHIDFSFFLSTFIFFCC